ncbi:MULTISPECIES: FAD-binding oxidoreductase [Anaerotruncus]|uniref:FAD-binding oxidoreductase n=1 Tax=Anaerotruncus TaxID=244127 RepID=UPI00082E4A5A|nr:MULTISPECIES: FAD-binding oxidoreductase [Anaerotruncus]RGX54696.1 FAD-binding oxidoreductase [Anaerotruncus sp. AF02-27]
MEMNEILWTTIRSELEDAVGPDNVDCSIADRITHGVDGFWISHMLVANNRIPPMPDFVVRPNSTEEVAKVLKIANYYKISVIPFGGASGSQGGIVPVSGGGIAIDMKRMSRILEFDEQSNVVTCETGINFQQLEWYVNERGYSTMHIPSAITCGTVGGFLANNGMGVLSTKYGKIEDQCISVEMVLPSGQILHTAPVPKHSSGPDMKALFIGSEGTFGIMTKASFKLFKLPEARLFRGFLFPDLTSGIAAVREMLHEYKPSLIRLYDESETTSIIKKIVGVGRKGAFMNMGVEGPREIAEIELRRSIEICAKHGGEDMGSEYGEKWWESRVTFFYPDHVFAYPQMFGTIDTLARYSKIENIYWAMKDAIESKYDNVRFLAHFSHWYDWGAMMYGRFVVNNPTVVEPIEAIRLHNQMWQTGLHAAIQAGGVVNDHHGTGLKLGKFMKEQYGSDMFVFEGLKKMFDPNGIMNPYKMGV